MLHKLQYWCYKSHNIDATQIKNTDATQVTRLMLHKSKYKCYTNHNIDAAHINIYWYYTSNNIDATQLAIMMLQRLQYRCFTRRIRLVLHKLYWCYISCTINTSIYTTRLERILLFLMNEGLFVVMLIRLISKSRVSKTAD